MTHEEETQALKAELAIRNQQIGLMGICLSNIENGAGVPEPVRNAATAALADASALANSIVVRVAEAERLREALIREETANTAAMREAAHLREALEDIAKGEGAYSRDPFEHACNTIDAMKERARAVLAALDAEAGK